MRRIFSASVAVALCWTAFAGAAAATPRTIVSEVTRRREYIGQCFTTRVSAVENRLRSPRGTVPGSGSKVIFADGHVNVEYSQVVAMDRSRRGDPVRLCVAKLPEECPKGDNRGIVYRAANLRTGMHWESSDSAHPCGGA